MRGLVAPEPLQSCTLHRGTWIGRGSASTVVVGGGGRGSISDDGPSFQEEEEGNGEGGVPAFEPHEVRMGMCGGGDNEGDGGGVDDCSQILTINKQGVIARCSARREVDVAHDEVGSGVVD